MDAAFGYRSDAAALAASAAQQGVEPEREPSEAGDDQQNAYREGAGDTYFSSGSVFMRKSRRRNLGLSRRGTNSRALLKCSASRSPASTAFSM